MQPRPYQTQCVEKVIKGFNEFDRQLAVMPTGSGKTVVFSFIASAMLPKKTLILAHREELVSQAIDKLNRATGIRAGKEKAESFASRDDSVVVGSIQTFSRRTGDWPRDHFGLVVADEAHHSTADSWRAVLEYFNAKVLGVTATPDRSDKRQLGSFYQNIPFEIGLFDLIQDGYLSQIKVKSVPISIDLTSVELTGGDFNKEQLGTALSPYLGSIARAIKEHAGGRKTLVFTPLIATSIEFKEHCLQAGLRAEHVDGDDERRAEKLAAFSNGEFDVLSNAMLLTEGYDEPSVSCVVNLRPTRSRPLYAQIAGRGTRLHPGKEDLLLLDFLFQHEKHQLCRPASLIAKDDAEAKAISDLSDNGEEEDLETLAQTAREAREEKLRKELEAKAKRKAKIIDPTDFLMMIKRGDLAEYEPVMQWESEPVSAKQSILLSDFGIDASGLRGKGHASQVINQVMDRQKHQLATPKQMAMLRRFKHPSPETASFAAAGAYIGLMFQRFGKR